MKKDEHYKNQFDSIILDIHLILDAINQSMNLLAKIVQQIKVLENNQEDEVIF